MYIIIYKILSIIKKMKKFIKWSLIITFFVVLIALVAVGLYITSVYVNAQSIPLSEEKLSSQSLTIEVFDSQNKPIKEDNEINKNYVKISLIPQQAIDAFLSIEDKNFYSHSGVNYKRIAKAFLSNIKSRKLKEGASTSTQQLVKNTLLSSEKTIERKIKEIALARKIENKYSKDEILEKYLNVIYFGNNCYGIENASKYYFSKDVKDISIAQSALLAGIIKSPAKYSPLKNSENCLKRRNLVLSEMYKDGKITSEQYTLAKNSDLELNVSTQTKNKLNSYSQASIDEAEEILHLPARQIALKGYKIYTYQDSEKQSALNNAFASQNLTSDYGGIVIDNEKLGITAYLGKSNYKVLEALRQPGSTIKPILVYAPALDKDIIYPCTQILDEKTVIAQYSPKNVGGVYHGYVSASDALAKSINIPAVKILSYVGIENAKDYAESMGIEFDNMDDSYALALGGMTYGVNLKQLTNAYSTFANNGEYGEAHFVSFITDKNGKLVYVNHPQGKKVMREDSAYLLTDMLTKCVKNGTARKLNEFDNIASKTGTVGKSGSNQNLDAWNVSYTKAQTVGVWTGNLDNTPIDYAGGNQPTNVVKAYFENVKDTSQFVRPSSIVEKAIDSTELNENHRIVLANDFLPQKYTQTEIFSAFNLPDEVSNKFMQVQKQEFKGKIVNNNIQISFNAKEYVTYDFLIDGKKVKSISGKIGALDITLPLSKKKEDVTVVYYYSQVPEIKQREDISFLNTSYSDSQSNHKSKWYI